MDGVNRVEQQLDCWLFSGSHGSDGACTPMSSAKRIAAILQPRNSHTDTDKADPAPRKEPSKRALAVAELLRKAIEKAISDHEFETEKEISDAAGLSSSGLNQLKRRGADRKTIGIRKLCRALRLNPDRLLDLKLHHVHGDAPPHPTTKRPDLHRLLDQLIGTDNETTVERLLAAMVQASGHDD